MNLLLSVDRRYVSQLKALLHSLFLNHPRREIRVHLLHSELRDGDIDMLADIVRRYGGELIPYRVSEAHERASRISPKYPPEAFYRLLCADYLPESVGRVLYLDGDVLVNGSLEALYHLNLTEGGKRHTFAAATDPFNYTVFKLFHKQSLGLPPEADYVNSGVLLMDVARLRETVSTSEILGQIPRYGQNLKLPDQDLLNVLFRDVILHIDPQRYNYCPSLSSSWMREFRPGYPAVIHFAGPDKPWDAAFPTQEPFAAQAKALYAHYAAL